MSDKSARADAAGAARLRHAIDHGGAGDKVAFPDPAAAPLGTDDEAAGHPPTRAQVRYAEAVELSRARPVRRRPPLRQRQVRQLNWRPAMLAGLMVMFGLVLTLAFGAA
ncbi:hypothetical protein [Marinovum sp.]|uniref:hypothetical protein n=1 Tax=Marinovum sp. TaxID=2024839 RepID=UPI003A8E1C0B